MPKTFPVPPNTTSVVIPDAVAAISQGDPTFVISTPPVNHAPTVSVNSVSPITLPTNSVKLIGKASDPDTGGTVALVLWEIVAGGGSFDDIHSYTPVLSNLAVGTTTVKFTAIDDQGAAASAQISIIVNAVTPPPTTGYTTIYTNPYSSKADIDPFGNNQQGNGVFDTVNFVSAPGSFKSRPSNVSSGIRSETSIPENLTPLEGAAEWDVMFNVIVADSGHWFQFHPSTQNGSASPGCWFNGKNSMDLHNWIKGVNQLHPLNWYPQLKQWYHIRIEWLFGTNGYFTMYVGGSIICQWKGQVGDNSQMYMKLGYNGWSSSSVNSDINYDNLVIMKKG